jgi:hypothetical protein
MRNLIFIFILGFGGCSNSEPIKHAFSENKAQAVSKGLWGVQFDSSRSALKPIKLSEVKNDTLTAWNITDIINGTSNSRFFVVFHYTSHDTVYLDLPPCKQVIEAFGNIEYEKIVIISTFSFTELKNIKYVSFECQSYNAPGGPRKVYSRLSWNDK